MSGAGVLRPGVGDGSGERALASGQLQARTATSATRPSAEGTRGSDVMSEGVA
jgi:hypothetical protein